MVSEKIIRMAREAGFERHDILLNHPKELERFAALVAAHERKECEKECDIQAGWGNPDERFGARQCAAAIRAKGQAA